jgi:hydrogenase expression/formation protein HypC
MKIVALAGAVAQVEESGVRREARVDLIEAPAVGDYVIVHAGIAIERLDPAEAEETLRLLQELFGAAE